MKKNRIFKWFMQQLLKLVMKLKKRKNQKKLFEDKEKNEKKSYFDDCCKNHLKI